MHSLNIEDNFSARKPPNGKKFVENKLNKRVSDIFHNREEVSFINRNYRDENKLKISAISDQLIEDKLKVIPT